MRKDSIEIISEIYESIEELLPEDRRVMEDARAIARQAYAPYSKFHVGAALELEDGTIVSGSNQENVAFPSGICAERTAIYYAGSHHPDQRIVRLAVMAFSEEFRVNYPVGPCGSCRQAIAEYENKQGAPIKIIMMGETGEVRIVGSVSDLLPFAFNESALKKD